MKIQLKTHFIPALAALLCFSSLTCLTLSHAGVGFQITEGDDITQVNLHSTLYFKNETGHPVEINDDILKFNFNRYLGARTDYRDTDGKKYRIGFKLNFEKYREGLKLEGDENIITIKDKGNPHATFLSTEIMNYNVNTDRGDIRVKLGQDAMINPDDLAKYSPILVHETLHLFGLVDRYWHTDAKTGEKPFVNPVDPRFANEIMGGINSQSLDGGKPISALTHDLNFKAIIEVAKDFLDMGITQFYIDEMTNFDVVNLKLNDHWKALPKNQNK